MTPKRYKLKKDLPTFKEGDEFIRYDNGNLIEIKPNGVVGVCTYSASTLEKFPNILTDWFEEIKPAEPLIKDEKIRKAVRAWASENIIEKAKFEYIAGTGSIFKDGIDGVEIGFYGYLKLTNRETYTITELCGEEEE